MPDFDENDVETMFASLTRTETIEPDQPVRPYLCEVAQ